MACQIKSGKKIQAALSGVKYSQKDSHAELVKNVQAAGKGMSARLCTEIDRKDYWLTILTNVMESLLSKINITRNTKGTDQITERLLQIDNIKLKINTQSNHIIELIEDSTFSIALHFSGSQCKLLKDYKNDYSDIFVIMLKILDSSNRKYQVKNALLVFLRLQTKYGS